MATLAFGGCAPPSGTGAPQATVDELLEADRAFARDTAERGLDGWMSWFAADAARFAPGGEITRGTAAIREHDASIFSDPTVRLVWEPTGGGLFDDGDHGFTVGRYDVVKSADGSPPETLSRGSYVSIWRRDASGAWKVILDTGSADPPEVGAGPAHFSFPGRARGPPSMSRRSSDTTTSPARRPASSSAR
jgi:ketosteroid isomerase-like protein